MQRFLLFLILAILSSKTFGQVDTINFETNSPLVEIDTTSGNIWQIGTPFKVVFDSAHSAPKAIVTDTLNTYPVNNTSTFTVGFELYGGQPYIEFTHRFDTDSLKDGGFVEISNDSGQTWMLLHSNTFLGPGGSNAFYNHYGLETSAFYGTADSLANGGIGFSGKSGGWITSQILFPCVGIKKPWELMLRFTFVSDSSDHQKEGWMIDDLYIFNTGNCSSLEENQLAAIEAYPNPFRFTARIKLSQAYFLNKGSYRMLDLQGRTVQEAQNLYGNSFEIERANLPSGLYTLVVSEDGVPVSAGKVSVY